MWGFLISYCTDFFILLVGYQFYFGYCYNYFFFKIYNGVYCYFFCIGRDFGNVVWSWIGECEEGVVSEFQIYLVLCFVFVFIVFFSFCVLLFLFISIDKNSIFRKLLWMLNVILCRKYSKCIVNNSYYYQCLGGSYFRVEGRKGIFGFGENILVKMKR